MISERPESSDDIPAAEERLKWNNPPDSDQVSSVASLAAQ